MLRGHYGVERQGKLLLLPRRCCNQYKRSLIYTRPLGTKETKYHPDVAMRYTVSKHIEYLEHSKVEICDFISRKATGILVSGVSIGTTRLSSAGLYDTVMYSLLTIQHVLHQWSRPIPELSLLVSCIILVRAIAISSACRARLADWLATLHKIYHTDMNRYDVYTRSSPRLQISHLQGRGLYVDAESTRMEKIPRKGLDGGHISEEISRHQLNLTLDEGRPCINRNAQVRI